MSINKRKQHWENIYQTKQLTEVGWYQPVPHTSLDFIRKLSVSNHDSIIDIGGGDSYLTDNLLLAGYSDITILDISEKAIERAKDRLGPNAKTVNWIVSDVLQFAPGRTFDIWHDRAAFHFLTNDQDIETYLKILNASLRPGGIFIIGTFSDQGPLMCSGLEIKQYSENALTTLLSNSFEKIESMNLDHVTPGGALQNYTFCSFQKLSA